ncbi:hypothetical protein [Lentzea flaviverrucosa]|uniref:Transmembrane protein n=1 Tax=Lentzea flaviverrucosa TaxID=200379 RepID=A0A1H9WG44_9PSEU|nr:hypothetical protein [Lentzea flaviverrucosa]RDI22147.1 hypothetical protein DFR72_11213 [Lentzea flaviverrucosa]SES32443.1 hypothetical protein SAMN05216195_111293 [Lentzea flaviverrucosa]
MTPLPLALACIWLGMVLAISIEAPLKFRAPGITLPLGLGIGRLVFRALNSAEIVLAAATTITFALVPRPVAATVLLVALAVTLAVQVTVLRPRLEARAALIIAGETPPKSRAHLAYIALEGAKVLVLIAFAVILL